MPAVSLPLAWARRHQFSFAFTATEIPVQSRPSQSCSSIHGSGPTDGLFDEVRSESIPNPVTEPHSRKEIDVHRVYIGGQIGGLR
jgi:hypothetical protein